MIDQFVGLAMDVANAPSRAQAFAKVENVEVDDALRGQRPAVGIVSPNAVDQSLDRCPADVDELAQNHGLGGCATALTTGFSNI